MPRYASDWEIIEGSSWCLRETRRKRGECRKSDERDHHSQGVVTPSAFTLSDGEESRRDGL